jgi:WD40 repeat protein
MTMKVDLPADGIAFALDGHVVVSAEGFRVRIRRPLTGALVHALPAHGRFLTTLSVSPNGRYIATVADHGDAQLWDAATGKQIADFGPLASYAAMPFSGASTRVAIVRNGSAEVHQTPSGQLVTAVREGKCTPSSASLDRHGDLLAAACSENDVLVSRVTDDRAVATLRGRGRVQTVSFSLDGRRVLTTSADQTATVWDARTGRRQSVLRGHTAGLSDASFSPNGKLIVTSGYDETARIWDADSGRQFAILRGGAAAAVSAVFSADSEYVVTGWADGAARVFAAPSGDPVETFRGHAIGIKRAVFSPDGNYIATIAGDHTARVFRCRACAPLSKLLSLADAELPHEAQGR